MILLLEQDALHIYTDGSSLQRPRRGGYAIRIVWLDSSHEEFYKDFEYPGKPGCTNNQMELQAAITGLSEALYFQPACKINTITIITDSRYVIDNRCSAIHDWPKSKWIGRDGPIQNVPLWKELTKAFKVHRASGVSVNFKWIKGHLKGSEKNIHHASVDEMARRAARNCIGKLGYGDTVRRRRFKDLKIREMVKISGQKFIIKIFNVQYSKVHKLYRLRFEVVSEKHINFGWQGVVYSEEPIRTRHKYLVTVDRINNIPKLIKIHRTYANEEDSKKAEQVNGIAYLTEAPY